MKGHHKGGTLRITPEFQTEVYQEIDHAFAQLELKPQQETDLENRVMQALTVAHMMGAGINEVRREVEGAVERLKPKKPALAMA